MFIKWKNTEINVYTVYCYLICRNYARLLTAIGH